MRGIPTAFIKYCAQQHDRTVLDVYKELYEGEAIDFDLTNQGNKFVCTKHTD